jgi:primase-polymerase (primpol)-like protein
VIRGRSGELHTFHARHFAEQVGEHPVSTNSHRSELTDEEVERLAKGATNSAKFEALNSGDFSGYEIHSEADQAYVSLLAFYTQDEEQLDRLYRRSGLCRKKWLDRPDYRHTTITHALSNLRETYTPEAGRPRSAEGLHQRQTSPSSGSGDRRVECGLRLAERPRAFAGWA